MDALRRSLSQAESLEQVFARYLKRGEKYLIFCSDWVHLQKIKAQLPVWFREVDDQPQCYSLYSGAPETEAEYAAFLADESDNLKLLLCINRQCRSWHRSYLREKTRDCQR